MDLAFKGKPALLLFSMIRNLSGVDIFEYGLNRLVVVNWLLSRESHLQGGTARVFRTGFTPVKDKKKLAASVLILQGFSGGEGDLVSIEWVA